MIKIITVIERDRLVCIMIATARINADKPETSFRPEKPFQPQKEEPTPTPGKMPEITDPNNPLKNFYYENDDDYFKWIA